MSVETETQLFDFQGWTFRYRPAKRTPGRFLLLLHGLTGDEDSLWPFTRRLSPEYSILAPRAPFPAPGGGHSWREMESGKWEFSSVNDLRATAGSLLAFVAAWLEETGYLRGNLPLQFDLLGFSQGASMAYTFALLFPGRVRAVAALSGILPAGAEALLSSQCLAGKAFFIACGRKDGYTPVERVRRSVTLLEESGARVTYYDDADTGHEISKECRKQMEIFFEDVLYQTNKVDGKRP